MLALAVALGGHTAWAQDAEPAPSAVETTTPADTVPTDTVPTATTPAEPSAGTPSEAPTTTTDPGTPAESTTDSPNTTAPTGTAPNTTAPGAPDQRDAEIPAEKRAEALEDAVQAQALPPVADLRVTAAFDRAEYPVDVAMSVRITVENVGKAVATDVRLREQTSLELVSGALELHRVPGPSLGPGERRTYDVVLRQRSADSDDEEWFGVTATQGAQSQFDLDPTPGDNSAYATTRVPRERGAVDVVVYVDTNGNGRPDDGEGRGGLWLTADGDSPTKRLNGVTAQDGSIRFGTATTGHYRLTIGYTTPTAGVPAPGSSEFDVVAGQTTTVLVPLVPPVSTVLEPTVEFVGDPYVNAGDPVQVKITLTNKGSAALSGVVAVCGRGGDTPGLSGTGPGWAALDADGPGIALAAGETRTLTITDVVPQEAFDAGQLMVACDFGNNGRNSAGYRGSSDFAAVTGRYGQVEGTLLVDSGEGERPLAGQAVVALDPATGLSAYTAYTGQDGRWRMDRVVAGRTRFVVPGEYKPREGTELVVDVVARRTTSTTFRVVPGPRWDVPTHAPKIEVTASFDKAEYDVRDVVTARIRVANNGTGTGYWVSFSEDYTATTLDYEREQWGDLRGYPSRGVELWPGDSREITITGTIRQWGVTDTVRLKGSLAYGQPAGGIDLSAKVRYEVGSAEVLVYGDANANEAFDEGEALPGMSVTTNGGLPQRYISGTTDASGVFRAEDVTAGVHEAYVDTHGTDWAKPDDYYGKFTVEGGETTRVELRLARPLSAVLHASLEFDKESYHKDETIGVTVKLTNDGPELLVKMGCGGELPSLTNGPEWGPFAFDGPGVVLKAGETREFHVVDTIDGYAADQGLISMSCGFGPQGHGDGYPWANDLATVTGVLVTVTGHLLTGDYPFQPVPDAAIVLVDHFTGRQVARAVADGEGAFAFADLQTGWYTPVVVGPWQLDPNRQPVFQVSTRWTDQREIHVVPGPEVTDPWQEQPGGGTPGEPGTPGGAGQPAGPGQQAGPGQPAGSGRQAAASGGGELADTGASVVGIGLLGLLVLVLGFVAVVTGRRRTA